MIVATAGHIDHGKTTLVKALTGVDTDRLPQEKERGISIDIGFAYWREPQGAMVGFVDVPGHERFVRNMLVGVCAIDYALLVVAADDGVMPQTREHLNILDLLAIERGAAVITKADRVDATRLAAVTAEVRSLLAGTRLAEVPILPVSAVTGAGMDTLRDTLSRAAAQRRDTHAAGRHMRYAVDRVFTKPGSGTVVTGTLFDGSVASGDRLRLSPSGREVRVRAIQRQLQASTVASAGERCALNLSGVELGEVQRGDWVLHPATHAPTLRMDVELRLLESEERPLNHWTPVHLHIGTRDVLARVSMRRGAAIEPGGQALAQLIIEQPVAALHGDRFILRDQSAQRTLGGGTVLDPWPPKRRRDAVQRQLQLQALRHPEPGQALLALLACTPAGVAIDAFARNFNLTEGATAQLLTEHALQRIGKDEAAVVLPKARIAQIEAAIQAALERFHAASPQAVGIEPAALHAECAPELGSAVFTTLLRNLSNAGAVQWQGNHVSKPRHVATQSPADLRTWALVKPALEAAGLTGLTVTQLTDTVGGKEAVLRDFLHRMARTGELVRVTPERFFLRPTLAVFAAAARSVAASEPEGRFTAARFRDRSGVGRALAVEVLEALDRLGITQRVGEVRVMRQDFVPILGDAQPPTPAAVPKAAAAPAVAPAARSSRPTPQRNYYRR